MRNVRALFFRLIAFSVSLSAQSADEKVFTELENRIANANITRNADELNKLFASDYMSVGVSGKIRTKSEIIDAVTSGKIVVSSAKTESLSVRRYGDFAVVVGHILVSAKDGNTDLGGRYTFTRVYKQEGKDWVAVSFEATLAK